MVRRIGRLYSLFACYGFDFVENCVRQVQAALERKAMSGA